MSLEKIIIYPYATLSSDNNLEKLEGCSKVALKPRDEDGNHILVLSHFDESNIDTTYKWARMFNDSAYDARWIGRRLVKWNDTVPKFGAGCLYTYSPDYAALALPYHARYNNLTDFTIEAFVRFHLDTGTKTIFNEYFYHTDKQGRWRLERNGTELRLITYDANGNYHTLSTSGLGLVTSQYYHIRFSHSYAGNVKISVDGTEVASSSIGKMLETLDETICPFITIGGYYNHPSMACINSDKICVDEFIMYKDILPSNYDVRTAACKPFSQDEPTATLTLDTGLKDAVWDASSILFVDETDFNNNGIKIRRDADDDNTPSFTGDPITLSQFRSGDNPLGRYLHLEFTFYSDGDTKRVLFPGKIDLCGGKPSMLARRAPEIVRR